jgi:hypothetical protein
MKNKVETSPENFQKQLAITNEINRLLKEVEDETGLYSFPNPILKHPSFLALVQMGDKIVNYLFYIMFEYGSGRVILLLLDKIVKDKPEIPKEHAGKFYHQTVDWMNWYLTSDYYKSNDIYFGLVC